MELNQFMMLDLSEEDLEPVNDDHGQRFKIRSERAAIWALRKIRDRQTEIDEHLATATAEKERIDAWLRDVNTKLDDDVKFFEFLLTEWHAEQIHAQLGMNPLHGPIDQTLWAKFSGKTHKLPGGSVSAKINQGKFESSAEGETIRFLDEIGRDDLVVRDPKISAKRFDDACGDPDAGIQRDRDGNYLIHVTTDWIPTPDARRRFLEAFESGAPAGSIIATFADDLEAAQEFAERNVRLSITEFDENARVDTWLVVPGVKKVGAGHIKFTVKADQE